MTVPRTLLSLLVTLVVAGCTGPGQAIAPQRIDREFDTSWIRWRTGERVFFAYKVFEDGGKAAICGVWAEDGAAKDLLNLELVRSMAVDIAGRRLVHSIAFFRKADAVENVRDISANCVRTDVDWTASFDRSPAELVTTRRRFSA
ncbi:MAG: hypothetical protein AAGC92_15765 [Pseudomonadota bacterium]